ncbi:ATP-dependent helicase [Vibrio fluvialis]|nr:ATP-dependent helicase [Vibrio fluvialis]
MGLSIENLEKIEKEKSCQILIESCIDSKQDFVFEAGAGAGKTFSLKESIKYVLTRNSRSLAANQRMVLCITYTNSAADELKSRVGNTCLADISTIHDAVWKIISNQKKALRNVHRYKVSREMNSLNMNFSNEDNGRVETWFKSQSDPFIRKKFIKRVLSKQFKELFYSRKKEGKIDDFKSEVDSFGYIYYRNKGKFEKTVSYIFKIGRLLQARKEIDKNKGVLVKYDSNINRDLLHRMKFSHDTLLEHALYICSDYPSMMDIIIDKYPYIFVDEFQDTSPLVIELLNKVSIRAKERGRSICVGYFGDPMQAIYSKGVGSKIRDIHSGLCLIKKKYNRRSFKEVIDVFDKFRVDELNQVSIYDDCEGGSFDYYFCIKKAGIKTSKLVKSFLPEIRKNINLEEDGEVCCLVLKNSTIAELVGFPELYRNLCRLFNYDDAPRLIINKDIGKLDFFVKCLFDIIKFIYKGEVRNKSLRYFIGDTSRSISLEESISYIGDIKGINLERDTVLNKILNELLSNYESSSNLFKDNVNQLFSFSSGNVNFEEFTKRIALEVSYYTFKDLDEVNDIIKDVLNIKLEEFIKWYEYLDKDINCSDIFMTCHNSKGLEYDNVVVFLEDHFEKKSDYMSALFNDIDNELYLSRRNLLYVSLSRAVKNLIVFYLCDNSDLADKAGKYFGKYKQWVLDISDVD